MKGATAFGGAYFGEGSGSAHLAYVQCTGSETSLLSCPSTDAYGLLYCFHGREAGVACAGATLLLNCKYTNNSFQLHFRFFYSSCLVTVSCIKVIQAYANVMLTMLYMLMMLHIKI